MLRRQTSFNHLFQATRLALNDPQVNSLLLHDWHRQDLTAVTKHALYVAHSLATSTASAPSAGVPVCKRRQPDPAILNPATVEVLTGCMSHSHSHNLTGIIVADLVADLVAVVVAVVVVSVW